MHPLDGAYEQVNGAREHLDSLRPEIERFAKVVADGISLKYKERFVRVKGEWHLVPIGTATAVINPPTPPRVSRLIGEVIQNLRTALDYLVYELACFDAKAIVNSTQFVVVDSEEDFRKNLWHLNGLSGEHIAAFEWLQPYNGHEWTRLIRDLSNPSKHQHLTAARTPVVVSIDPKNTKAILAGENVSVDSYATIQITFSQGSPVIECLDELIEMTVKTLESFKPEFQRS